MTKESKKGKDAKTSSSTRRKSGKTPATAIETIPSSQFPPSPEVREAIRRLTMREEAVGSEPSAQTGQTFKGQTAPTLKNIKYDDILVFVKQYTEVFNNQKRKSPQRDGESTWAWEERIASMLPMTTSIPNPVHRIYLFNQMWPMVQDRPEFIEANTYRDEDGEGPTQYHAPESFNDLSWGMVLASLSAYNQTRVNTITQNEYITKYMETVKFDLDITIAPLEQFYMYKARREAFAEKYSNSLTALGINPDMVCQAYFQGLRPDGAFKAVARHLSKNAEANKFISEQFDDVKEVERLTLPFWTDLQKTFDNWGATAYQLMTVDNGPSMTPSDAAIINPKLIVIFNARVKEDFYKRGTSTPRSSQPSIKTIVARGRTQERGQGKPHPQSKSVGAPTDSKKRPRESSLPAGLINCSACGKQHHNPKCYNCQVRHQVGGVDLTAVGSSYGDHAPDKCPSICWWCGKEGRTRANECKDTWRCPFRPSTGFGRGENPAKKQKTIKAILPDGGRGSKVVDTNTTAPSDEDDNTPAILNISRVELVSSSHIRASLAAGTSKKQPLVEAEVLMDSGATDCEKLISWRSVKNLGLESSVKPLPRPITEQVAGGGTVQIEWMVTIPVVILHIPKSKTGAAPFDVELNGQTWLVLPGKTAEIILGEKFIKEKLKFGMSEELYLHWRRYASSSAPWTGGGIKTIAKSAGEREKTLQETELSYSPETPPEKKIAFGKGLRPQADNPPPMRDFNAQLAKEKAAKESARKDFHYTYCCQEGAEVEDIEDCLVCQEEFGKTTFNNYKNIAPPIINPNIFINKQSGTTSSTELSEGPHRPATDNPPIQNSREFWRRRGTTSKEVVKNKICYRNNTILNINSIYKDCIMTKITRVDTHHLLYKNRLRYEHTRIKEKMTKTDNFVRLYSFNLEDWQRGVPILEDDINKMNPYYVKDGQEAQVDPVILQAAETLWDTAGNPSDEAELEEAIQQQIDKAAILLKMTSQQKIQFVQVIEEYRDVFRLRFGHDEPAKFEPMKVRLKPGSVPQRVRNRPYSEEHMEKMKEILDDLEEHKLIFRNNSSRWAASVQMIAKPGRPGDYRLCIDLRYINSCTVPIQNSMPILEDVLKQALGCYFFFKGDLCQGYWQILLAEADREKYSFMTPFGVFSPNRLPQGSSDAPLYFQGCVQEAFADLIKEGKVVVWIDDIMGFAKTWDEYIDLLRRVFAQCVKYGLKLHIKKTEIGCEETTYCGRIINRHGVKMNPRNYETFLKMSNIHRRQENSPPSCMG